MVIAKEKNLIRISFVVPKETLKQIDEYVGENFLTRTKWFYDAANMKLKKDKQRGIDDVIKGE